MTLEALKREKMLINLRSLSYFNIKKLLDEVEHDIMNYHCQGLTYLPKPKAEADNRDTRFNDS